MGTSLRGFGWYKLDLLRAIYAEYGLGEFAYSEAARLSKFDRKTFISLCNDGWLVGKKERKSRTCMWRLSAAFVSIMFGNDIPDDVPLEHGVKHRAPRRSKRLVMESELFYKQILEAIEFFSKPEVVT